MRRITIGIAVWLTVNPGASRSIAASPEAAPTGSLSVSSDPTGAAVYLDGRFVGQTPVNVARLTAGGHRVRLNRAGHLENGRIVTIAPGKTETLNVRLTAQPMTTAVLEGQTEDSTRSKSGGSKKWLYIGLAAAGVATAAVVLATANHAPTVSAVTASPGTGLQASTTISFSAQASDRDNDPLTYSWDFGDGGTSSSPSPQHVFNSAGTFTVRLTVGDGKTSASGQTSVTIRSLTGTWRSSSVGYVFGGVPQGTMQWMISLTQSGPAATGSIQAVGAIAQLSSPGTIAGTVRSTPPTVTLVGNVPAWLVPTFTLDPNADVNTLTGRWTDTGSSQSITFTRQ